jgi:phytoene synthase
MEDAFAHCERLVREADKDRFFAALYAPANRRRQLFALYAFNIEIAAVRDRISQPMAGELRLQWWRDALVGERAAEARGSPVAAALIQTVIRSQLPLKLLTDLIDARRFDLYDEPMGSLAQLEGYARRTSSALFELGALILDGPSNQVASAAEPAGIAYALTGLLRSLPVHAARRQTYLPVELLEQHGAKIENLFAGRLTPELRASLGDMHERIEKHLRVYERVAASLPPAVAPVFLPISLVRLYLRKLRRSNPLKPVAVPQWRRQWTMWRAARRVGDV